jgi:glycosyltransferase involved in cell wall biosynthesis
MAPPDLDSSLHVSAVICTRNRADKIRQAVDSVLANEYPAFDLTIIDQSTTDDTRRAVDSLIGVDQRFTYIHSDVAGLSRAYNAAVAATSGSILAFTDDDCIAPANWIKTVNDAFAGDPDADLLYGQVVAYLREADDPELTPALHFERPERIGRSASPFRVFGMGANFAARRRLFERAGPFDEVLGGGGALRSSQDFDLAFRAYRAGSIIALRPEVVIEHDGRREAVDWPSLLFAYGVGDGAFYSKHIRCRDALAMWIFARHLTTQFGKFAAKKVLGRRPDNWQYLKGMLVGVRDGRRFEIDRAARLYRQPQAAPRAAGVTS